ncbi:hypothetical protein HPG69_009020 [Diceros bicornis minor]|uniref:Uncharacterized protein n=1 Tax=Diceros bicornis minor TaxID=77932 RepID=A0A7J7EBE6_DICBM|nr:hypothetical protein HPG69_009020 [Diceros bicornis minor]
MQRAAEGARPAWRRGAPALLRPLPFFFLFACKSRRRGRQQRAELVQREATSSSASTRCSLSILFLSIAPKTRRAFVGTRAGEESSPDYLRSAEMTEVMMNTPSMEEIGLNPRKDGLSYQVPGKGSGPTGQFSQPLGPSDHSAGSEG